jgi:hypothetical protein
MLLLVDPLSGQQGDVSERSRWRVASARMVAEVIDGGPHAEVGIEYVLVGGEGGGLIPIQLLGFSGATSTELRVDGQSESVVLSPTSGSLRAATLRAPENADGAGFTLALSYEIEKAIEARGGAVRARIPIAVVALPNEEGVQDIFQALVRVPADWAVTEAFPTGLSAERGGDYRVSLAVTPSFVGFRARTDGLVRPGLPLVLGVLMVTLLGAFSVFGWRHLRRLSP